MIRSINVNRYKVPFGGLEERELEAYTNRLRDIIALTLGHRIDLQKIDMYNMEHKPYVFNAGSPERAIIFANATRTGAPNGSESKELVVSGDAYMANMLHPHGSGLIITSDNGVPLAEYFHSNNELNILFDLFHTNDDVMERTFTFILNKWYELHFKLLALRDSWKFSPIKGELTLTFQERMERALTQSIQEGRNRISDYERRIEESKRNIKSYYDNLIRTMKQVELDESNKSDATNKLIADLDLIVEHPKVEDIHIKGNKFVVFIPNIYCYTENGKRYYIGNFRVEITLENAEVRFFGDNPRKSYWTRQDPHPHVSGDHNGACLGNVASTIAELASRNEIYALTLICIDFLESANTADVAGKNVINWDEVDKDGNIIRQVNNEEDFGDDPWTCERCERTQHEDHDGYTVYNSYSHEDGVQGERYVCESCLSNYTYWGSVGSYVHSDYNENDYFDDEGDRI